MFSIIIATTRSGGIGFDNEIPWICPEDMKHFKQLTTSCSYRKQNAIIMGRKTWESINKRPLPNRLNVVLSSSSELDVPHGVLVYDSLDRALQSLSVMKNIETIFVIGGSQVYKEAIQHPHCFHFYRTVIHDDVECDVFVPMDLPSEFSLMDSEIIDKCEFQHWTRTSVECENPEEKQYLEILKDILEKGTVRMDRTGTGVKSKFGYTMRFDLSQNRFPLLTTKKVFFRGVVEELLWFLGGNTNAKLLRDKGVKIWDGNASRSYLDSIGLVDREEDDLGPIYGFQWRHFGARYRTMRDDYTGEGIDQIQDLIHRIKTKPSDRRLILTAWNPLDLKLMALPPCHCFCQFYVDGKKLSCQMYQRSCDMGLGVPFNIASYALLTVIMAHVCDLEPGEFIHVLGDAHIYMNHVDAIQEQLKRVPHAFPKLTVTSPSKDISTFSSDDFKLVDYNPLEKIKMSMSV
jgi:dihydrofolate reductase/thymidylate synthase